eukprot:403333576
MDNSKAVQQVTSLIGMENQQQNKDNNQPVDKTLCPLHRLKMTFFCEEKECLLELCFTCRDKHERGHVIKFKEETAKLVIEKFKESLDKLQGLRHDLYEASNDDPTKYPVAEGQIDILEQGNKEIDHIYEKILKQLEQSKQEMKDRLKEAYIANYKHSLDQKSETFLKNLDKLEKHLSECVPDFEKRFGKGKTTLICQQRPKVDQLKEKLEQLNLAFKKMVENSRDFDQEYQLSFKLPDFEDHLKELLNAHINVSFPGLDNGFFKVKNKLFVSQKSLDKKSSQQNQSQNVSTPQGSMKFNQNNNNNQIQTSSSYKEEIKSSNNSSSSKQEFDPIKSLENEEYDIRRAKEYQVILLNQQQLQQNNPGIIVGDPKYEIRTMKFKKDKFEVKSYDAQNKKSTNIEILIPDEIKRIPTRFFSYVNIGNKKVLMSGGFYIDDKTCSLDCFKISINKQEIKETKSYMKVARMHHSMIYIEEKRFVLVVGGEDENNNLLDSCELYNRSDKSWKMLNTLNQRGKNISLCKFVKDKKADLTSADKPIYVYAFGRVAIERIEVTKIPINPRWEELNVKGFMPFPQGAISFKHDDNLIVLCGGVDEKNQYQHLQDIYYFNPTFMIMEKAQNTQLGLGDKFLGGAMTQYVINRMDSKIVFCSESFVHELEYGVKTGEAKFKCRANLY